MEKLGESLSKAKNETWCNSRIYSTCAISNIQQCKKKKIDGQDFCSDCSKDLTPERTSSKSYFLDSQLPKVWELWGRFDQPSTWARKCKKKKNCSRCTTTNSTSICSKCTVNQQPINTVSPQNIEDDTPIAHIIPTESFIQLGYNLLQNNTPLQDWFLQHDLPTNKVPSLIKKGIRKPKHLLDMLEPDIEKLDLVEYEKIRFLKALGLLKTNCV